MQRNSSNNSWSLTRSLLLGLIVVELIFGCARVNAQALWEGISPQFDWAPTGLYPDSVGGNLYITGGFQYVDGLQTYGIIAYDGVQWRVVSDNPMPHPVRAVCRYNNKIFVGGARGLAVWDGITWDSVAEAGLIWDLCPDTNGLILGGNFEKVGNDSVDCLAKWNGVNFNPISGSDQIFGENQSFSVTRAVYFDGDLIVAGNMNDNGTKKEIMRLHNGIWTDVGGGIGGGGAAWINDLVVYHDELYIAGYFYESNGSPGNNVAKWTGSSWERLGNGLGTGQAWDMLVYQDKLLVYGQFTFADTIYSPWLASWDGSSWCALDTNLTTPIVCMAEFDGELYVAAPIITTEYDSIVSVAKWIGGNHADACVLVSVHATEPRTAQAIQLYPNPTAGEVAVSLPDAAVCELRVLDLTGREVLPSMRYRSGDRSLDVSNLSSGIYVVEVRLRSRVENLRLIKE